MRERDDRLFRGLEPAGPPQELRDRTLRAAQRAMTRPATPDLWAQLWQSRRARLAWTAAAAVLLIGHVWVGSGPANTSRDGVLPALASAASHDQELAELVGLPRVSNRAWSWIHRAEDPTSNHDGAPVPSSTTGSLS